MNLGEKIKNIRKSKEYTLKDLSDMTGLSLGFLSNVERDLNSPSISNLQQICQALGINLMEILSEEQEEKPVTRTKEREEIFNNNKTSLKVERLLSGKESLNGIAIMEILSEEQEEKPVTRTKEREEIFNNNKTSLKVERLLSGKESLNGIAITIDEKGAFHDLSWGHGYDEIGVVIKGELEIELDKTLYHLYEGDSIFIKENTPHRYRNPQDCQSVVYWFSSKK